MLIGEILWFFRLFFVGVKLFLMLYIFMLRGCVFCLMSEIKLLGCFKCVGFVGIIILFGGNFIFLLNCVCVVKLFWLLWIFILVLSKDCSSVGV